MTTKQGISTIKQIKQTLILNHIDKEENQNSFLYTFSSNEHYRFLKYFYFFRLLITGKPFIISVYEEIIGLLATFFNLKTS